MMKSWAILGVFLGSFAHAATEVSNRSDLQRMMGVQSYPSFSSGSASGLKIAILDNGFDGYSAGSGQLPASTELYNPTSIPAAHTTHGLGMAEIVWAMTGMRPEGPKFYLINSNGFSNFKAGVQYAIQQKVDVILYSQVWPFGGNFDGTGFINAVVTQAVNAGITWINAAGNNGGMVYNGQVSELASGKDSFTFENLFDDASVSVTLSWTDFQDSEYYNTNKDLDLFIYDSSGKLVGSSELIQRGEAPPQNDANSKLSSHARETVSLSQLVRGNYRIQVKNKSGNFASSDRFRIYLNPERLDGVRFTDKSTGSEIMPPADHPGVFTIGERGPMTAVGPTADGRAKPEILVPDSRVSFTNGMDAQGTSTAAAIFAGTYLVMKAQEPGLNASGLRRVIAGLASRVPGGEGVGLRPADPSGLPINARALMPADAKLMIHTRGYYVILTANDPLSYPNLVASGIFRLRPDDLLFFSPFEGKWYVLPRNLEYQMRPPAIEFRARNGSNGALIWSAPDALDLRRWVLGS